MVVAVNDQRLKADATITREAFLAIAGHDYGVSAIRLSAPE